MSSRPRLALFVDQPDKGGGPLGVALATCGVDCMAMSLRDCGFDLDIRHGLKLPGLDGDLPDAVVVRFIAGGSFEEVTLRLGILHALADLGVPVFNSPQAIERCVDKAATGFHLRRHNVPTPPCWTCDERDDALAVVRRQATRDRPLVLKPLFGAQGRDLRLIGGEDDLPPAEDVAGVYYLQRYVPPAGGNPDSDWRDWRVMVVGGRPIAAMIRHGASWITNIRQGARAEPAATDGVLGDTAVAAAAAVGAFFAGVDLVRDAEGRWLVLEVNSMPAWSGLQGVTDLNIAQVIADAVMARTGPMPRAATG